MLDPMFALGSVLTKDIITAAQMGLSGVGVGTGCCPHSLAARRPRSRRGSGLREQQAGPRDHLTGWPHPSDFITVMWGQHGG